MNPATVYAADVTSNKQNVVQRTRPLLTLSKRPPLPATMQEISRYIDQLLTTDEQSICDRATD